MPRKVAPRLSGWVAPPEKREDSRPEPVAQQPGQPASQCQWAPGRLADLLLLLLLLLLGLGELAGLAGLLWRQPGRVPGSKVERGEMRAVLQQVAPHQEGREKSAETLADNWNKSLLHALPDDSSGEQRQALWNLDSGRIVVVVVVVVVVVDMESCWVE